MSEASRLVTDDAGERCLDGLLHRAGGHEVRVAQDDGNDVVVQELRDDFLLHDGALGDGAHRLRAVGILRGHDPSLRHGVGLPVGRLEVRLQEDAAVEVARVADAGHRDVDAVPRRARTREAPRSP